MALGLVSFPIFARTFSVADYGVINLVLQTVLIFTVVSKAGLQNSVQRFELELASAGPTHKQSFFSTIFLGNAAIAVLVTALFCIGVAIVPDGLLSPSVKKIVLLASLLIVARAVLAMYFNLLQVEGKTLLLNALDVATKAAAILAVCSLAFMWRRTAVVFFVGTVIAEVGVLFILLPDFWHRTGKKLGLLDTQLLRKVIAFGLPLMWAELAWVVLDSGDRFLVRYFCGTEPVGYYAAAYNIATAMQGLMLTPLNLAFFPVCVGIWTNNGEERTKAFLSRTLSYFMLVAVGVVAGTMLVSGDLIVILASRRYLQGRVLLPWLVAGLTICALQVFFKTALMLRKEPMKIAHVTTVAALFNIGLNLVLIPRLGILGAAVATFVSYALWIFLMARAALRVLPFPIDYAALARYLISGAIGTYVASFIALQNTFARPLLRIAVFAGCYAALVFVLDRNIRDLALRRLRRGASEQNATGRLGSVETQHDQV
jgi:O-antigen/teichoic acid export membrane protein